jgi:hypothetical protein
LRTFFLGGAHELALDKNGSIGIPPRLLKFARLKQRVTLMEMRFGDERVLVVQPAGSSGSSSGFEQDRGGGVWDAGARRVFGKIKVIAQQLAAQILARKDFEPVDSCHFQN